MQLRTPSWQAKADAKVKDLQSKIPKEWVLQDVDLQKAKEQRTLTGSFMDQFLDKHELEILANDSVQLVASIQRRQYTAVEVVRSYCKAAAIAQQINNCLHEIMFDLAMQTARDLDRHYKETGNVKGPLHGLPVSLKDQFHVEGYDTTMGYVGWIGTYEGSHDLNKVHKNPGQDTYASSVGVMGTSIEALKLLMTSMLSTEPWNDDPNVVKMPWDYEIEASTLARAHPDGSAKEDLELKLGILWTDGVVRPQPPVRRALRLVFNTLGDLGHKAGQAIVHSLTEYPTRVAVEVLDWKPPSHSTANKILGAFFMADGCHDIHRQLDLSGEPLMPPLRRGFQLKDPLPLLEYQDFTLQGKAYNETYSDYWNSTSSGDGRIVDAFIMPVAPNAAVIPGKYSYGAYTEPINLLDYSAVVIPVTKAEKSIDKFDHDYQPMNGADRKTWEAYDPETYDGAPVGLQIVGRKWDEEKIWAISKIIDTALRTAAR
ncbi:MAG: hypothetical protein Q9186_003723 [Xanthomendoza sp. 1 TL-2023]